MRVDDVSGAPEPSFAPREVEVVESGADTYALLPDPLPGDLHWATVSIGWDNAPRRILGLDVLSDGTIVAGGLYADGLIVDPGTTTERMVGAVSTGVTDAFLIRYERNGAMRWFRQLRATLDSQAGTTHVRRFPDDSLMALGYFGLAPCGGPCGLILGVGEPDETTIRVVGTTEVGTNAEVFLARYRSDGDFQWVRHIGVEGGSCWGGGVAILPDDDLVVAGTCMSTGFGPAIFSVGQPDAATITMPLRGTGWIARYSPSGALRWTRWVGTGGITAAPHAVSAGAPTSDFYVTGEFGGVDGAETIFGAGEPTETRFTPSGRATDGFLARYGTDGALRWVRRFRGRTANIGFALGTNARGDAYVAGRLAVAGTTFAEGEPEEIVVSASDDFVARYRPDGRFMWVVQLPHRTYTRDDELSEGLAVLPDGRWGYTARFDRPIVLGAGEPAETELVPQPWAVTGAYVAAFEADGSLRWARASLGANTDPQDHSALAARWNADCLATAGQWWGSARYQFRSGVDVTYYAASSTYVECWAP